MPSPNVRHARTPPLAAPHRWVTGTRGLRTPLARELTDPAAGSAGGVIGRVRTRGEVPAAAGTDCQSLLQGCAHASDRPPSSPTRRHTSTPTNGARRRLHSRERGPFLRDGTCGGGSESPRWSSPPGLSLASPFGGGGPLHPSSARRLGRRGGSPERAASGGSAVRRHRGRHRGQRSARRCGGPVPAVGMARARGARLSSGPPCHHGVGASPGPGGVTGRRRGLKPLGSSERAGSNPAPGTLAANPGGWEPRHRIGTVSAWATCGSASSAPA
jgi:hypothetical protein